MTLEEKKDYKQKIAHQYGISEEDIDDVLIPFLYVVESNSNQVKNVSVVLNQRLQVLEKSLTAQMQQSIKPKIYNPPNVQSMNAWKAFWTTLAANPIFSTLMGASLTIALVSIISFCYGCYTDYQSRQEWKQQATEKIHQQFLQHYFTIREDGSLFMPKEHYQVTKGGIVLNNK